LRSVTRSQLNIKIDPELLTRVKAHATRQGITLTDFVATVLAKAISDEDALTLEERISRIEKHLGLAD
jgi:antitoxin component of RelBE/YafQ-DinJ toxin-antitoxin module